ncbi:MAG TPA: hypothetical protein PLH19_05185 [Anaerolineae bacterium]|nr:hypothetical protein [Anaerolineae bacterium]HQH37914.1 hypothetical protein [Anaerolineae bacterium]
MGDTHEGRGQDLWRAERLERQTPPALLVDGDFCQLDMAPLRGILHPADGDNVSVVCHPVAAQSARFADGNPCGGWVARITRSMVNVADVEAPLAPTFDQSVNVFVQWLHTILFRALLDLDPASAKFDAEIIVIREAQVIVDARRLGLRSVFAVVIAGQHVGGWGPG